MTCGATRRRFSAWPSNAPAAALAVLSVVTPAAASDVPPQAAWALLDLATGRVVSEARRDVLDTPVQPGSLMKIVVLDAAMASGVVTPATRLACPRRLRVGDHVFDCSHPDLGRPLSPPEALAHSCNGFFAQVATRVSRDDLDRAARRWRLPPVGTTADPVQAALGVDRYRVPPRRWLEAIAMLSKGGPGGPSAPARDTIREGLRAAARTGTVAVLAGLPGVLGKTGTAPMPGGGIEGLALVLDESAPRARALVVVAPGGSGRDAAAIAAAILARPQPEPPGASRPAVRLGVTRSGGVEAREVPLEDYVAGVVAGEAPGAGLAAVQRAMAIAARTVVEGRRGRHRREGFDVCDTTHCQVVRAATPASRAAAEQTAGLVLAWEGRVAEIYYAASCGGTLADPGHVWPGRRVAWPPYLTARGDPAGDGLHEARWQADLPVSTAVQVLRASGLRGERLDALSVRARDAQGRATSLHAAGFTPDTVSAEAFRMAAGRVAGWALVKSTWFDLVRTAAGYRLTGRGLGHGVGLCVRGAAAMAEAGRTTAELLEAYFPGTALRQAEDLARSDREPAIRVVLSSSDERHRPAIEAEARSFMRQLSGRLLVAAPGSITLRFHPTVSSYQRATGQPWWTSAATTGTRVDLLPASTLEARQRLVPTLRHEIVHVMTAAALEGKPRWVQEGVARYYTWTGEARRAAAVRTSRPCPDDATFADAGSGEALDLLYERSSACVSLALESGRTWRDLP